MPSLISLPAQMIAFTTQPFSASIVTDVANRGSELGASQSDARVPGVANEVHARADAKGGA